MKLFLAALLLWSGSIVLTTAVHAEPWDTTERTLAITAVTALVMDWGQTRHIVKNPEQFYEKNLILGDHPSMSRVNVYFIGAIAGTLLIGDWLEPKTRKLFLGTVTALEVVTNFSNHSIGIRVSF